MHTHTHTHTHTHIHSTMDLSRLWVQYLPNQVLLTRKFCNLSDLQVVNFQSSDPQQMWFLDCEETGFEMVRESVVYTTRKHEVHTEAVHPVSHRLMNMPTKLDLFCLENHIQ